MQSLILFAVFGAVLAEPRVPERIVDGDSTTIHRYPYMALVLRLTSTWTHCCGGSLITTSSVLSAAHCYLSIRPSDYRVRLGSTSAFSGGAIHLVSALILHEQFNMSTYLNNDVAIVRLASDAVLSATVGVARIASSSYNIADNTVVHAIGWGALWYNGPLADNLQHAQVYTINHALCAARYAHLKTMPDFQFWPDITPGMLCAGILDVGGRDVCKGDSGGPLVYREDIIFGITSWGFECADATYPGVYTRVSLYANWIIENA